MRPWCQTSRWLLLRSGAARPLSWAAAIDARSHHRLSRSPNYCWRSDYLTGCVLPLGMLTGCLAILTCSGKECHLRNQIQIQIKQIKSRKRIIISISNHNRRLQENLKMKDITFPLHLWKYEKVTYFWPFRLQIQVCQLPAKAHRSI